MPIPHPKAVGRLRRLVRDEEGSVAIESMLVLPILIWAYLGCYVFFDGYHSQSVGVKAAYTIGDALSRETGFVTPEYMTSLYDLQDFLVDQNDDRRLRITVFRYDEALDRYTVIWSQTRGGGAQHTTTTLATERGRLPIMADADIAILTETSVTFEPAFNVELDTLTFNDFVVTRPRFASQLCWNSLDNGGMGTATC